MEEVNAQKEMELAKIDIKLREDRKALTTGGSEEVQMPKMKITVCLKSLFVLVSVLNLLELSGCEAIRRCTFQTSTVDNAYGGLHKPRCTGREDCRRTTEPQGSWKQIW